MKIDAGTALQYTARHAQESHPTAVSERPPKALDKSEPLDFKNITQRQMLDWVNGQIQSGRMSLDESRPFMAMTINIPMGGANMERISVSSGGERINFVDKIQAGIEGALNRKDETTLAMLESALGIVNRHQGKAASINTFV